MKRVTFDEVTKCEYPTKFIISPNCKHPTVGFYTDLRIKRDTVPDGWYLYEIRGDDEGKGDFVTIEDHVWVNFMGSLLTKKKIKYYNNKDYFNLNNRYGYTFA